MWGWRLGSRKRKHPLGKRAALGVWGEIQIVRTRKNARENGRHSGHSGRRAEKIRQPFPDASVQDASGCYEGVTFFLRCLLFKKRRLEQEQTEGTENEGMRGVDLQSPFLSPSCKRIRLNKRCSTPSELRPRTSHHEGHDEHEEGFRRFLEPGGGRGLDSRPTPVRTNGKWHPTIRPLIPSCSSCSSWSTGSQSTVSSRTEVASTTEQLPLAGGGLCTFCANQADLRLVQVGYHSLGSNAGPTHHLFRPRDATFEMEYRRLGRGK